MDHVNPYERYESSQSDRRRRPAPRLPAGTGRRRDLHPFTDADLARARRHGALTRLEHGIYDAGGHQRPAAMATLQALTAAGDAVVSHDTAAALQGLWGAPLQKPFHLTVPRALTRLRRQGVVVGHRSDIPDAQLTRIAGVPVTTAARTWADRAVGLGVEEALVDADIALRTPRHEFEGPGEPAATQQELFDVLDSLRGRQGVRVLRQAAELARDGADSPQETRLRLALHLAGLPEPEVNVWVLDDHGRRAFQPDLMFRKWRVAVQYEGPHHSDPRQVEVDVGRAELAVALGWDEVRITRRHMGQRRRPAVHKVAAALIRRGWSR